MIDNIGLYIHVPFCRRGCFYCHFLKFQYEERAMETYLEALKKEIRLKSCDREPDTIYLGGGSPSLLPGQRVKEILDTVRDCFSVNPEAECTLEANPEDVSLELLESYKEAGINRLSLGTQSFVPADLEFLQRGHDTIQSRRAVETALKAGFNNINLDFIINLPTQTLESLEKNLETLKEFSIPIPHISAYLLEGEFEEDTGHKETEREDELDHELYYFTRDYLTGLGYEHYEVSNFARPGYRGRHNLKYWHNLDYTGLGPGAAGYENGEDYNNTKSAKEYREMLTAGKLPKIETEHRDPALRRLVMGLRLFDGVAASCFEGFEKPLEFLKSNGFLVSKGKNIAVNPEKMLLLNEILGYVMG